MEGGVDVYLKSNRLRQFGDTCSVSRKYREVEQVPVQAALFAGLRTPTLRLCLFRSPRGRQGSIPSGMMRQDG
jgi:hypothetical protein